MTEDESYISENITEQVLREIRRHNGAIALEVVARLVAEICADEALRTRQDLQPRILARAQEYSAIQLDTALRLHGHDPVDRDPVSLSALLDRLTQPDRRKG